MTLKEKIRDLVEKAYYEDVRINEAADAILAAIREHMTSTEAVERASEALFERYFGDGKMRILYATQAAILAALGENQ